jgi:type I restriction enzyme S subunit
MAFSLGLEELNEDSAVPGLNRETAYNQDIALPPLPEQKAIASVLSSLDDKIDLLHRQNKTLEAMAETLFRQWFIEEAKEDWGEIAFGELVDLHDSKRVPLSQLQRDEKRVGQLYPYYGASGIIDYINAHIFEGDYLLLSEDGENLRTRKTPIAFEANGRFWVNNHAHVMQAKLPYTNGLLRILLEGENLDSIITGAVQPKINQANLISYKIPNFPHDLVQQYVTVSDPWFKKVSYNKQQIQTLENLRDTLRQDCHQ